MDSKTRMGPVAPRIDNGWPENNPYPRPIASAPTSDSIVPILFSVVSPSKPPNAT